MMYISRLLVSGFKTQTSTRPNPGRNRRIVRLHVPGQGTTTKGYNMSKKKWDALPIMTYKFTMYKEDAAGNQKFYDYNGDHSSFTDGIYNEDLNEIEQEDA